MRRVTSVFLLLCFVSGCEATIRGEPLDSLDPNRDLARLVISSTLDEDRVRRLLTATTLSRQARNEIIRARIAEIDILYFQYERQLTRELRESGFLLSLLGIGVGSAGALVTQSASQILSAASASLAGARVAFDSEMLVEQTFQAFQAQMRASRDLVRSDILRKLKEPTDLYPLQAAVADLAQYRQAGTLTEALIAISKDAQVSARAAEREVRTAEAELLSFQYNQTPAGTRLRQYVIRGDLAATERQRRMDLLRSMIGGQRAHGLTDCNVPPDVLIEAPPPGCLALQSKIVELLVEMGEIDG
ncbi:MAG TPA: hypothetical protein VFJ13_10940 [Paracoccaceae bacterium]|nr:hypothetical protein [Paracoccaceae bacterium]